MEEMDAAQLAPQLTEDQSPDSEDAQLQAILEAIVYITDEPLTAQQIAAAIGQPIDKIKRLLDQLVADYAKPEHGLSIREIAGGYKMATKAEHHEAVRAFVKKLTPPLKLSLPALETLAVIAYKQPVTKPEIEAIRGVNADYVLHSLLERNLVAIVGRAATPGRPLLYGTTLDFLKHFGINDLSELPKPREINELMAEAEFEVEKRMLKELEEKRAAEEGPGSDGRIVGRIEGANEPDGAGDDLPGVDELTGDPDQ